MYKSNMKSVDEPPIDWIWVDTYKKTKHLNATDIKQYDDRFVKIPHSYSAWCRKLMRSRPIECAILITIGTCILLIVEWATTIIWLMQLSLGMCLALLASPLLLVCILLPIWGITNSIGFVVVLMSTVATICPGYFALSLLDFKPRGSTGILWRTWTILFTILLVLTEVLGVMRAYPPVSCSPWPLKHIEHLERCSAHLACLLAWLCFSNLLHKTFTGEPLMLPGTVKEWISYPDLHLALHGAAMLSRHWREKVVKWAIHFLRTRLQEQDAITMRLLMLLRKHTALLKHLRYALIECIPPRLGIIIIVTTRSTSVRVLMPALLLTLIASFYNEPYVTYFSTFLFLAMVIVALFNEAATMTQILDRSATVIQRLCALIPDTYRTHVYTMNMILNFMEHTQSISDLIMAGHKYFLRIKHILASRVKRVKTLGISAIRINYEQL